MLDRYNRNITYLRISVTDRCNLRCIYCMPAAGVKLRASDEILSYEEIIQIVKKAIKLGISKVRLTGGEPLLRKNISFLVNRLKALSGIQEITMTTNGVLLSSMAAELKKAGLDRLNVSLDTLDPHKYRTITRGGDIRKVLAGIEAAFKAGFKGTKLNMVLIPEINEMCVEKMAVFCREKGLILQRISRYFLSDHSSINQALPVERPPSCARCNRIRLTADGKLKPCLFSDQEYPVDHGDIVSAIKKTIINKPKFGLGCTVRGNWQIGG